MWPGHYASRFCVLMALLAVHNLTAIQILHADPGALSELQGNHVFDSTDESPSETPLVSVILLHKSVGEGKEATFRIRRNIPRGNLRVNLRLGGTAAPGIDFMVEGLDGPSLTDGAVHFVDGQMAAVVAVDVIDDIVAEGRESIVLTLAEGDGYELLLESAPAILLIPANHTAVTVTADY